MDWGNWFAIARVRYDENLDLTNLRENNQNVRYIEEWYIDLNFFLFFCGVTSRYPAFWDRNDYCKYICAFDSFMKLQYTIQVCI